MAVGNKDNAKSIATYIANSLLLNGTTNVLRYDAYSTNSVYLKVDYGLGGTIRISDHTGKKHLAYGFNLNLSPNEKYKKDKTSQGYTTEQFPYSMLPELLNAVYMRICQKRIDYKNDVLYRNVMQQAIRQGKNNPGFWQQEKEVQVQEPSSL